MVERNKHKSKPQGDPKLVPYFFDPNDADQTPETLKRWRREHLIQVGSADTMEKRKWHLSQAVRCDLALISRGIIPPIPTGVLPKKESNPMSELINESGLTEEQAQDILSRYYEESLEAQKMLGEGGPAPVDEDNVGMDAFGEVATERPQPKIVEGNYFGATHLKIVSQPPASVGGKDKKTSYDCGCVHNDTQNRWDFHCMAFRSGRCPTAEAQRAREEADKQMVNGNSVTNCPSCLSEGGVVKMEYQYASKWKCPICGHWADVTPNANRTEAAGVSVEDQPPCGCFWPYKFCAVCKPAYEAWWHRQVEAGLVNEVACPLEPGPVNRALTQLEAAKEAEQGTHDPFALTPGMRGVLDREMKRLQEKNDTTS